MAKIQKNERGLERNNGESGRDTRLYTKLDSSAELGVGDYDSSSGHSQHFPVGRTSPKVRNKAIEYILARLFDPAKYRYQRVVEDLSGDE